MTTRWTLNEVVDPYGAQVIVTADDNAAVRSVRFDLSGLPRIDAMLAGRPVLEVPKLVERLCGICPAAHHLAGLRALEALADQLTVPLGAQLVRRLLHYGSALDAYVMRLLADDRDSALVLRKFAKAAMAAAGSPGHFPTTGVVGGVRAPAVVNGLGAEVAKLLEVLVISAERRLTDSEADDTFAGAAAALVDASGQPDLLGDYLRIVGDEVIAPGAPPERWDDLVAEELPGEAAPRPYVRALGPETGRYRVGPVAQLLVGDLQTPIAADLQERWRVHRGAAAARAVMAVHAMEALSAILESEEATAPMPVPHAEVGDGVGVGWVDGPRGLLVHRYETFAGRLVRATILTPTAQNEPWLAQMLQGALAGGLLDLEDAIREADPCLPCSAAPAGAMGLSVVRVQADQGA